MRVHILTLSLFLLESSLANPLALAQNPDQGRPKATMFHGPQTLPGSVPAIPSPKGPVKGPNLLPGTPVIPSPRGPVRGPWSGDPPPQPPRNPLPIPSGQPLGKATMSHGPHTVRDVPPGKATMFHGPLTAGPASPPQPKATMWHGPQTGRTAGGRAPAAAPEPTPQPNADCKAPYDIGSAISTSSGTCIQYKKTIFATSMVNCAGCPPSQPGPAKAEISNSALVGFGGLFGPGPAIFPAGCMAMEVKDTVTVTAVRCQPN